MSTPDKEGKETSINIDKFVSHDVLLAEIGGGPRWKQVNFPIEIFQNFFGAKKGDNSYIINLMNVNTEGVVGEIESRQAVTVKSNNYRFEINCKETTGPYPGPENRPIGLFVKISDNEFIYQVLLQGMEAYDRIKSYLSLEANPKRIDELKRVIVDVEAIHALYPNFII